MGLAAPKNRTRISNDPQNTHWAGNTSRFGHRILTSQGWKPGSSLGAKDAAHSSHYTAASHSHIRVLLKEDNLGLGAKRGSERAENFGLAGLESVLGRLNGNEEEVKKEEARRDEIDKRAYVYRKFGFMNFVSGGYLVGDKIEKMIKKEDNIVVKKELESDGEASTKKRKRDDDDTPEIKEENAEEPKLKRKKKSMNLREEAAKEDVAKKSKKEKREKSGKKDKKRHKSATSDPEPESHSDAPTPASDPEPLTEKARRKAEKRARKEEKKLKKALKKAAKKAAKANASDDASSDSEEEEEASSSAPTSTTATGTSTPVVSAVGLTFGAGGRHAIRQRYIRQKKMASMDPQALKEIFMIKTPS